MRNITTTNHTKGLFFWRLLFRNCLAIFISLCFTMAANADSTVLCSSIFPNGLQAYGSTGEVVFQYNAQLLSGSSKTIKTKTLQVNVWSPRLSCATEQCVTTGVPSEKAVSKSFKQTTSLVSVNVPWATTQNLGDATHFEFNQVVISSTSTLTLSAAAPQYRFKDLRLQYQSKLKLSAGDYWIENLTMDSESAIEVQGTGTVRLYVKNSFNLSWMAGLNKNTADASRLVLYSYADVNFQSNSTTYGAIYSEGKINLEYSARVTGAISAGKINLDTESAVVYQSNILTRTNFADICAVQSIADTVPPILTVTTPAASTENSTIFISGTAVDPAQANSGISSVTAITNSGQRLPATINGDNFSVTVPLVVGTNTITLEAKDLSNNISTKAVVVRRKSLPSFQNITPANGVKVTTPVININGEIWNDGPVGSVQFSVNGVTKTLTLASPGIYRFSLSNVALTLGANSFLLHATTPDGSADFTLNITYAKPDSDGDGHPDDEDAFPLDPNEWADLDKDGIGDNSDPDRDGDGFSNDVELQRSTNPNDPNDYPDVVAPLLQITTANNQNVTLDTMTVSGTVSDTIQPHSGLKSVIATSAKGQKINVTLNGNNFTVAVPLSLGENVITLEALDISNNSISKTLTVTRKSQPVLQNIQPVSGITVSVPSTSLSGEVITAWPLNNIQFTVNNTQYPLVAVRDGVYSFQINNLPLVAGANNYVVRITTPDGNATASVSIRYVNTDRDGDGHPDDVDAFPDDPNEWSDLDHDGIGDNSDPDRDGDGISNDYETQLGTNPNDATSTPPDRDHDGIPDQLDDDRDGDGHPNNQDKFPDDPTEWADLDNDGIGDNADPDRDGDGFSNIIEEQAGTNPNDATDYPDTVAPLIQITNPANERVESSFVIVHGTASDPVQPHSGLKSLIIHSDKFTADTQAVVNNNLFDTQVPLALGVNRLTIKAVDQSGNTVEATYTLTRISPPHFNNITPTTGSTINANKVTIAGEVITELPLSAVSFYVNEWQISPSGTRTPNTYAFDLPNIPLQVGQNIFTLRVVTDDGVDEHSLVLTRAAEDPVKTPVPKLALVTPASGSQLRDSLFRIKGKVTTYAGSANVTINGQPATISSVNGQDAYFEGSLSFANGEDVLDVVIRATDSLQRTTTLNATYTRDSLAPQIALEGGFQAVPFMNPALQASFTVTGTVADANLASMTLNDQPIALSPDTQLGHYRFAVPVNLAPGEQKLLAFSAYDLSGNQTHIEYQFNSTATTAITPLLPGEASEFISKGQAIVVQVAARLANSNTNNTAVVTLGSNSAPLTITGTLASGEITLPSQPGDYALTYQVLNSANAVIASSTRQLRVINEQAIAVELVRHKPDNGDINIETNQPIELYFNKPIEPAKLSITVNETLHGNTYLNTDAPGTDFLNAQGYQLQKVDHDNEPIAGGISLLPDNQSLGFYASRQFGYNASLYVNVTYDNKELARFNFKIRPLPTFVMGSVADQFGQPLPGIKVKLSVGNRSAVTNKDGGFAFGFQEPAGSEIPDGRYNLTINPDLVTPGYGTQIRTITVQAGRKNELGLMRLTELSAAIPFQQITSHQANVSLAGDELRLNLADAGLLFNSETASGRTSGSVQAQFMPLEQITSPMFPGATPNWVFAVQPRGVVVEGKVGIDLKMPALRGTYDYLPTDMVYVVLLGYNPEHGIIEPVGVGKIENYRVTSVGKITLKSLDYFGYALVMPDKQTVLKDVADGKKTMQELLSVLQL